MYLVINNLTMLSKHTVTRVVTFCSCGYCLNNFLSCIYEDYLSFMNSFAELGVDIDMEVNAWLFNFPQFF